MLELGNIEYMFSPWLLEWAQIFMKKHEFLRSGKEDCRNYNQGPAPRPRITVAGGEGDDWLIWFFSIRMKIVNF